MQDSITVRFLRDQNNKEFALLFGAKLKMLRNILKFRQTDVANAIDVTQTRISNFESGKHAPSFAEVDVVSLFFDVPVGIFSYRVDMKEFYTFLRQKGRIKTNTMLLEKHSNYKTLVIRYDPNNKEETLQKLINLGIIPDAQPLED